MKQRLKKNTAAELAYVRSLERSGPLRRVERGEARLLSASEYPEPIKRFLARERRTVRVPLSPSTRKKLEQLSRDSGVPMDQLARRWVEQGIEREAG